jgi:hypothetical protein
MDLYQIWNSQGLVCIATSTGKHAVMGELVPINWLDIDWHDVTAAVEAEGWCGTYSRGKPTVIAPFTHRDDYGNLPEIAAQYLAQE